VLIIILSVFVIVLEPNPANLLNQEAAEVFRDDINAFKENVQKSLAEGKSGWR